MSKCLLLAHACGASCLNLLLTLLPPLHSPPPHQIYLPIYEVAAAQELCTELWGSAGGPRSEFERLADMALAVAAFKEADETGDGQRRSTSGISLALLPATPRAMLFPEAAAHLCCLLAHHT